MGKMSRSKGRRYEQQLARIYRAWGYDVSRNSNQAHQDAQGEDPKGDLLGVATGSTRVHVQAKHQEHLNIWDALRQAESDAPKDFIPTVHFKRNHTGNYVALPLGYFISLLQRAK